MDTLSLSLSLSLPLLLSPSLPTGLPVARGNVYASASSSAWVILYVTHVEADLARLAYLDEVRGECPEASWGGVKGEPPPLRGYLSFQLLGFFLCV